MTRGHQYTKALKGRGFKKKPICNSLYRNVQSVLTNKLFVPTDWLFVPSIRKSVLSDCNLFPRFTQRVPSNCNSSPLRQDNGFSKKKKWNELQSKKTDCQYEGTNCNPKERTSREVRTAIRENGLSNSRERFMWKRIAQFDITVYALTYERANIN